MKLIAWVICTVCVRPAPWSGRSEAIRKSASVDPLIALHDDAGSAVRLPPPPPEAAVVVSPPPLLDSSSPPHPAATSDSAAVAASAAMVRRLTVGIPPTRLAVGRAAVSAVRAAGRKRPRPGYDRRRPKWRNWQTRRTQNPVPLGECGFDSHLRHSRVTSSRAKRAICRWRDESGQAIVLSAVWMLVLLGMAGLVIDVGSWERVHRHLQSA